MHQPLHLDLTTTCPRLLLWPRKITLLQTPTDLQDVEEPESVDVGAVKGVGGEGDQRGVAHNSHVRDELEHRLPRANVLQRKAQGAGHPSKVSQKHRQRD